MLWNHYNGANVAEFIPELLIFPTIHYNNALVSLALLGTYKTPGYA